MGRKRRGGSGVERVYGAAKVCDLPEGQSEIDEAEAGDCAAHPTGSDRLLQTLQPRLLRGVDEEEVIAPIAQPERMHPGQKRQHDARFEAQNDVKDDG